MTTKPHQVILSALPATSAQIRQKTGYTHAVVARWLSYLRTSGQAHIGHWETVDRGGAPAAVYVAGAGADAMRGDKQARRRAKVAEPPKRDAITAAWFGQKRV